MSHRQEILLIGAVIKIKSLFSACLLSEKPKEVYNQTKIFMKMVDNTIDTNRVHTQQQLSVDVVGAAAT